MQCSRGHQNQTDASFCVVCGEQLVAASPPAPPQYQPYPDQPYPHQPFPNPPFPNSSFPPGMVPQNGKGTASLVLGILGLLICPVILSVLAIILGAQGKALADQGLATNRGTAQAGFVLGIIGAALGALLFLIFLTV